MKVVSLPVLKKSQMNDLQRTKWVSVLTSDLTMTPFINFRRRKLPNNPGCTLGHKYQVNSLTIFAWFYLCSRPLIVFKQSTSFVFVNFAAMDKTLQI